MVCSMSAELALQSVLQMYTCNRNLLIDNQLHIRCALLVRSKSPCIDSTYKLSVADIICTTLCCWLPLHIILLCCNKSLRGRCTYSRAGHVFLAARADLQQCHASLYAVIFEIKTNLQLGILMELQPSSIA